MKIIFAGLNKPELDSDTEHWSATRRVGEKMMWQLFRRLARNRPKAEEPVAPELLLADLHRILKWAAADPDQQVEMFVGYFRGKHDIRALPDELALDMGEIRLVLPRLEEQGLISSEEAADLVKLDHLFKEMTDRHDPNLWTLDGMRSATEWADIRNLAKEILVRMGDRLRLEIPGTRNSGDTI